MNLWLFPDVLNSKSNGHRALIYALIGLQGKGVKCAIIVKSLKRFKRYSSIYIPESLTIYSIDNFPNNATSLVVLDSSDPVIVDIFRQKNLRIIWWLLAPPGLLDIPFPSFQPEDIVLPYSSFVVPGARDYCFIQDPSDIPMRARLNQNKVFNHQKRSPPSRKKIGIYCGKGKVTVLSKAIHELLINEQPILFNRFWPKESKLYHDLITSLDALISFDPLTAVVLDCAANGKPVYLPNNPFPESCYIEFPLSCLEKVYTDDIMFAEDLFQAFRLLDDIERYNHLNGEIQLANKQGIHILERVVGFSAVSSESVGNDTLLSDLRNYSHYLRSRSTIYPLLNGQAPSASLLSIYVTLVKMRLLEFRAINACFRGAFVFIDWLVAYRIGGFFLRAIFYPRSALIALIRRCYKK